MAKQATKAQAVPARRSRQVVLSYWAATFYVLILLTLVLLLWSARREHESHVKVPDLKDFEQALPSIAGLTKAPILPGNRIEVLQNGDGFFPPLFRDIAAAKESIHIETYVWWKGEICRQVAEALAAKARQGVEVRLTLDAVGTQKGDDELFDTMRKAGVKIALFHPFQFQDIGLFNNRTHRKVAVIDGRIGYLFGHGIAQEWTGHAQDEKHWRDTGVRVEGPVVNEIQAVFCENWMEETAEVLVGQKYFPRLVPVGKTRAHVIASSPQGGVSEIELLFKLSIATAQKQLLIENPYFIPDGELIGLLSHAVERGVDVRIMVPGQVTDSSVVRHAGHQAFEELLRHGIKIYEYQRTLNHQKVIIVDGVWSFVGSTNLDDRSLDINDEASIGLIDPAVAAVLRTAYAHDLESCRPVVLSTWSHRSLWHKMIDKASYLINEQL